MSKDNLRNGTELLLSLVLSLELMDEYPTRQEVKRKGNLFRKSFEAKLLKAYDEMYKADEEFTINALNMKHKCISQIASLNEADAILLYDFVDKFIKNIDVARKKGIVFFDKLN